MGINFLIVESPSSQRSSILYLGLCQVVAGSSVLKHFLTNRNWTFNGSVHNLFFWVECQVHNIEVIPSVYGAHVWNAFGKMMGDYMSVALKNSIDGASWQCFDQFWHFIALLAWILSSLSCPNSISQIQRTFVTDMSDK